MAGIFKAYDVRGLYPDQINEPIARKIGLALQFLIDPETSEHGRQIVVSHDMRSHSKPLVEALIDGLRSAGFDVVDVGLATTPMNYFAVGHLGTAGGVQVTASHNPARYNGIKFSLHGARPVSGDEGLPLLEKKVASGELPEAAQRGGYERADIFDAYADHLLSFVEKPAGAGRLKVVCDAANGMGVIYRPILERLDIDLVPLYFELDGTFPNHEANPLKYENLADLSALIKESGADIGVAFDGDADRAGFVDELGRPIGSDFATGLIASRLLAKRKGAVVYDVRSTRALAEYINELGGVPRRERVGHSFIKATLRETNGVFGGELAGHYYFPETFYADSSLLAVIQMLNLLWSDTKPLSAWLEPLERYAKSEEINFEVEDKESAMRGLAERYADGRIDHLDGISVDFDDWWFNVRPSNTEPLLRLVLEADTNELLADKTAELVSILGDPV